MYSRLDTQMESVFSFTPESINPSKSLSIVEGAFDVFDNDQSGFLKKTEFIKFLTQIVKDLGGEDPSIESIQEIMDLLDINGDGQISKKQVLVLFKRVFQIVGEQHPRNYQLN